LPLLLPRPPRPTLFPYTTLFRSTCTTIAQKFVNDGDDLIFAIATPAAQACAAETEEIPIVLTGVTDPAGSGLVDTNEAPGGLVGDRKSTRLNSSHVSISYAVFCL